MAQQLYRVVETMWVGGNRVEKDIGCDWKTESRAKDELRTLNERHGNNGSRIHKIIHATLS